MFTSLSNSTVHQIIISSLSNITQVLIAHRSKFSSLAIEWLTRYWLFLWTIASSWQTIIRPLDKCHSTRYKIRSVGNKWVRGHVLQGTKTTVMARSQIWFGIFLNSEGKKRMVQGPVLRTPAPQPATDTFVQCCILQKQPIPHLSVAIKIIFISMIKCRHYIF
jgi:hypothetical protein